MKNKSIIPILIPILLALFFLSLPIKINSALRDRGGLYFSRVWRLIHPLKKKGVSYEKKEALASFLQDRAHTQDVYNKRGQSVIKELAAHTYVKAQKILVGCVLYRSRHTWNSSLWIDVGEEDNPQDGPPLIAKNSPVLSGDVLVGVVDFVGKKTSLVRLITDSGLTPAVRIARGGIENRRLHSQIQELSQFVTSKKDAFKNLEDQKTFLSLLSELQKNFPVDQEEHLLAKGELQGLAEPHLTTSQLLHGVGFNYDFKDEHGPARDLRTGASFDKEDEYTPRQTLPLLQVGDLLVTSGMDGIFPEGLKTARVHSISPLREGAYSYELLAKPIEDLADLETVFVLPPQNFDLSEAPTKVEKLMDEIGEEE